MNRDEAKAAARAASWTSEASGRTLLHSFLGGIGADWDLADVEALIDRAQAAAWSPNVMGHDLAVEVVDADRRRLYHFEVRAPDATAELA